MPTAQQLQNILNNYLGLRVGTTTDGAAYSMGDFGMDDSSVIDVFKWTLNPTSDTTRVQLWENHLYNTVWKIFDLSDVPFNLMIVSYAMHGGKHAESYKAENGVGDKQTFKKCNKLTPNSKITAQRAVTDQDTYQTIVDWVLQNI